jgi:hypothetical protein
MFMLVQLLEHLGLSSGAAIVVVIVVMKLIKGGARKILARRDRGRRATGWDNGASTPARAHARAKQDGTQAWR